MELEELLEFHEKNSQNVENKSQEKPQSVAKEIQIENKTLLQNEYKDNIIQSIRFSKKVKDLQDESKKEKDDPEDMHKFPLLAERRKETSIETNNSSSVKKPCSQNTSM